MADTVILSAIQEIDCFLLEKTYLWEITKEQVEGIKNDLELMLDFLKHKKLEEDAYGSRLNYLVSDVVEMAHDAQNLIESEKSNRYTFHGGMESIRRGLRETKKRMLQVLVEGAESPIRSENVGDLVGLEKDVGVLLRKAIFQEEARLFTVCIEGIVGIGKSTLARQLYNRGAVTAHFQRRAWACVSSEFSNKEVLMKLILQLLDTEEIKRDELSEKMERADNASLQEILREHLRGMRYFIVLDGVCEYTYLESVLKALPHEDKASRLVLTSRTHNIRAPVNYFHQMKFLDDHKSWQLFLKTVFFGTTSDLKFPRYPEKMARDMVIRCNGLPLAIKELGRQLATKRLSGTEWEELLESIDLGSILAVLELSYHELPSELKSCFLHLGFFKERTTIRAEKLVQIWTIGGVVPGEEIGYLNLLELTRKSILQMKDMTIDFRIKNCGISDFLHELSIKKSEEEISFHVLRLDGKSRINEEPRHRAIYCSRENFSYFKEQEENLVSLFFHKGGYLDASPSYWERYELLRILDFEDFGLAVLPETIGTLNSLRYLGLRSNYIQELPHSLSRLKNLEVLDIALNFMVEVPDIVWEMGSLRHLYMSDVICRKPLKIDALENLETLTYISVDNWTYELSGLQKMTRLRKLGIEEVDGNSNVGKLLASLVELENLDRLILRGFRFTSMPSLDELGILHRLTQLKLDGLLTRLPSANNFPPNILYLTLVNSSLDEDPMPVLEKLSKLCYLKLRNTYAGQQMVISHDGFPALEFLCIEELWHLRNVQVGEGAMRMLWQLEINSCPYLKTLPEEMITNLEGLKMVTTKNIARKIRESGLISKIRDVNIRQ